MKIDDFDYPLPEELIAQFPPEKRGDSRLLLFDRKTGRISHLHFSEIVDFLGEADLLVFNDTRVIPARLLGRKESGGKVEVLLVREVEDGFWEALLRASKSPPAGGRLHLEGEIEAEVEERLEESFLLRLRSPGKLMAAIERYGRVPLPPYIGREPVRDEGERYQTIYAARNGAVAAPTAGLHFTEEIMDSLRGKGVGMEMITLHVGPGTFQPVRVENVDDHSMHEEYFEIGKGASERINETRGRGGRVIAVGTTSVRALESSFSGGKVLPKSGRTDIFIRPGYGFRVVDALITNFHLPKSTLFMLVSALVGTERLKDIYAEAVKERYRFFSYGDAMLIL